MLSVLIALVAGSALGAALFFTTSLHPVVSAITGWQALPSSMFLSSSRS